MKVSVNMMYRYWESTSQLALPEAPVNTPPASLILPERQSVVTNLTPTNNTYVDPMGNIAFNF